MDLDHSHAPAGNGASTADLTHPGPASSEQHVDIDGVIVTPLRIIRDIRGEVRHGMRATDPHFAGFGEAYFSVVTPGMRKGWKRHRRMTMNLIPVAGTTRFEIHDDRPDSPTSGMTATIELSPEGPYACLTVPPMTWLAFEAVSDEPAIILNVADIVHDPEEADNRPLLDSQTSCGADPPHDQPGLPGTPTAV